MFQRESNGALLHEWIDALREHTELPPPVPLASPDSLAKSEIIWLRWTRLLPPNHDYYPGYIRTFEALELLALLARVDYDEWLRVLKEIWPNEGAFWAEAFYPHTFQLGVEVYVYQGGQLSKWAERGLLHDPALTSVDNDYDSVRGELEASLLRVTSGDRPEIQVSAVLQDEQNHDGFSQLLFETVQLASAQAMRKTSQPYSQRWEPLFRLADVRFELDYYELRFKDVVYSSEIAACGVRIQWLDANSLVDSSNASRNVACLHRLIVAPDACSNVTVYSHTPQHTVDGIFSSISHSKATRYLTFQATNDSDVVEDNGRSYNGRVMQWLALSVIGTFRCPSIDKVTLYGNAISKRDVHVLVHALQQEDPLTELFPSIKDLSDDAPTVATASNFVLVDPSEAAASFPTNRLVLPHKRLRILAIYDRWVRVLLPRWGQAWTDRSHATLEHRKPSTPLDSRPLEQLDIVCIPHDHSPVALELLRVVGCSLRTLQLQWKGRGELLSNDWVRQLCLACPVLHKLRLTNTNLETLDAFAQVYEEGICHVKRLDVHVAHSGERSESTSLIFDCLSDQKRQLSKRLQVLTLRLPHSSNDFSRVLESMHKMLQRNTVLGNVNVSFFGIDKRDRRTIEATKKAILRHCGEPVSGRFAPLRLKSKIAFLSVIHSPHASARSQLDTQLLALIFAFAAESKKRHLNVEICWSNT